MDINEALQVVNNLFDYLSEIGELDEEDFHRMNEAEDVINNYVRKTMATACCGNVVSDPDIVSKIKKQMSIYPDEHTEQAKKKLIESFSKQERHPVYSVVLEHPEEMPVISKDKIEQFKEELNEAQYIIYDKFGMPKKEITFEKEGVVN